MNVGKVASGLKNNVWALSKGETTKAVRCHIRAVTAISGGALIFPELYQARIRASVFFFSRGLATLTDENYIPPSSQCHWFFQSLWWPRDQRLLPRPRKCRARCFEDAACRFNLGHPSISKPILLRLRVFSMDLPGESLSARCTFPFCPPTFNDSITNDLMSPTLLSWLRLTTPFFAETHHPFLW